MALDRIDLHHPHHPHLHKVSLQQDPEEMLLSALLQVHHLRREILHLAHMEERWAEGVGGIAGIRSLQSTVLWLRLKGLQYGAEEGHGRIVGHLDQVWRHLLPLGGHPRILAQHRTATHLSRICFLLRIQMKSPLRLDRPRRAMTAAEGIDGQS